MGKRTVLVAALLLIAAGVAGWFLMKGDDAESAAPPSAVNPTDGARDVTDHGRRKPPDETLATDTDHATPPYSSGVVVDEDGTPVAGARILIRSHTEIAGDRVEANINPASETACTTGSDGRFTLADEPADIATLAVLADGFEIAEIRSPGRDLRIVLHRRAPFRTRVVDSNGRPIANAAVVLIGVIDWDGGGRRTSVIAHTSADGAVEFGSVPADARVGSILVAGYALTELHNTPFGVELRDEYALTRTALIIDITAAEDGAPIAGARGTVVATAGSVVGALAFEGGRHFRPPPPGRLLWRPARGCSGIPLTVNVTAPERASRALSVTLAEGVEPPHLEITLAAGDAAPSISGRVVDGAGAVVTVRARPEYPDGFHLQAADHELPIVVAATVGDDGAFAFAGLPPATYCITLTHAERPSTSLDVSAPVQGLELSFPAQAVLDVTITDDTGSPLPNAWVHVQTSDGRGIFELQTDADGHALFDPVPAVALIVVPVRNSSAIPAVVLDHPAMPHERVEPTAGETARITLVRPAGTMVTVIVREGTDAPVRDATVRVKMYRGLGAFLRKDRQRIEAREWFTDADGRVVLDLPPCGGSVTVIARERSATAKFSTTDPEPVEIRLPTEFGVVRGRVIELGTGRAVAGRPVSVRTDGQRAGGAMTDADGRLVVSRVPAGRVKISVDGRQDEDGAFEPTSPYPYASVELDLAGDEDRSIEIAIPRIRGDDAVPATATLRARVLDPDDGPAEGASVVASGRFGDVRVMLADGPVDSDGRVSLPLPNADTYIVVAFVMERSTEVELETLTAEELVMRLPAR